MIRVCMDCRGVYGEKEPFEDTRETTGYCPKCYEKMIIKMRRYRKGQELVGSMRKNWENSKKRGGEKYGGKF